MAAKYQKGGSMKKFLRPDEIATELGVSVRTVYNLIGCGYLTAFSLRKNGALRIPAESFKRYVRDRVLAYEAENGIFFVKADEK